MESGRKKPVEKPIFIQFLPTAERIDQSKADMTRNRLQLRHFQDTRMQKADTVSKQFDLFKNSPDF